MTIRFQSNALTKPKTAADNGGSAVWTPGGRTVSGFAVAQYRAPEPPLGKLRGQRIRTIAFSSGLGSSVVISFRQAIAAVGASFFADTSFAAEQTVAATRICV